MVTQQIHVGPPNLQNQVSFLKRIDWTQNCIVFLFTLEIDIDPVDLLDLLTPTQFAVVVFWLFTLNWHEFSKYNLRVK